MLFNSHEFLFAFLPGVLALYFLVRRFHEKARLAVILVASLAFYAWWDWRFLALLGASICANYTIGILLTISRSEQQDRRSNLIVGAGVGFNLLILAIF